MIPFKLKSRNTNLDYPHLKWEIYWYEALIGREPEERVVALVEDAKHAKAIAELLNGFYCSPVNYRERK